MRRIKRTKITVIRTETVFLQVRDARINPDQARELFKNQPADSEAAEIVRKIEASGKETDSQGEVK